MTALVGIFGTGAAAAPDVLPAMLDAMPGRGSGGVETRRFDGAFLAAQAHPWESGIGGWAGPLIVEDAQWVLAADASLYYLDDLRRRLARRLAGKRAAPADLLLAALHEWGVQLGRYVEGDYALIAWNRESRRVVLAREFAGKRTLTWTAVPGGTLVVASAPRAVAEFPGVSSELDDVFVTAAVSTLDCSGRRTAFRDIHAIEAGTVLALSDDGRTVGRDTWQPPEFSTEWRQDVDREAAEAFRALLRAACLERLPPQGGATVWMSGGWDSTSVFASLRDAAIPDPIEILSLEYPDNDQGNEVRFIQPLADRWMTPVHWLPVDNFGLFDDSGRNTARADDPMPHPFEPVLRGLGQATVGLGHQVAFEGTGGDHLFLASGPAIHAQLLADGGFRDLARLLWAARPPFRQLLRACLLPNLAEDTLEWIGQVRGRALRSSWEYPLPDWLEDTMAFRSMRAENVQRLPGEGPARYEVRFLLTGARLSRVASHLHRFGLDEGVVVRSPFLDRRLMEFVATRPMSDRGYGGDAKRLLRRSMKGLIPDQVLAPRPRKTGVPVDYFGRQLRTDLARALDDAFPVGGSNLEALGIISGSKMRLAVEGFARGYDHLTGSSLHTALLVERWIARAGRGC